MFRWMGDSKVGPRRQGSPPPTTPQPKHGHAANAEPDPEMEVAAPSQAPTRIRRRYLRREAQTCRTRCVLLRAARLLASVSSRRTARSSSTACRLKRSCCLRRGHRRLRRLSPAKIVSRRRSRARTRQHPGCSLHQFPPDGSSHRRCGHASPPAMRRWQSSKSSLSPRLASCGLIVSGRRDAKHGKRRSELAAVIGWRQTPRARFH